MNSIERRPRPLGTDKEKAMQNNGLFKALLTQFSAGRPWALRVGLQRQISAIKMLADVHALAALLLSNSALSRTNDADALYEFAA